jgi:hypothetical protein
LGKYQIEWPIILLALSAAMIWIAVEKFRDWRRKLKKRRARGFRRMRPPTHRARSPWQGPRSAAIRHRQH